MVAQNGKWQGDDITANGGAYCTQLPYHCWPSCRISICTLILNTICCDITPFATYIYLLPFAICHLPFWTTILKLTVQTLGGSKMAAVIGCYFPLIWDYCGSDVRIGSASILVEKEDVFYLIV